MTSPRPDPGDRAELHRPGGHGPEAPQRHDAPSAEAPHGGVADDLPDPHEVLGKRNRLLFRPNRADPSLIINEYRERDQHISIGLTLKQTFGSGGGTKVAKKD